jgi:Uma2 family endonuclease
MATNQSITDTLITDFQLEDPPEKQPEDMTTFPQFTANGTVASLAAHLGNPETTIIAGELYIVRNRPANARGVRYPDLYIAFDVDPDLHYRQNGYIISDQGKAPDFAMEIASTATRPNDDGAKRIDYRELGIREYWRFDRRRARPGRPSLAGDRLEEDLYVPIAIHEDDEGRLWGYSEVLGVRICWEDGFLRWYDPVVNRYLTTYREAEEGRLAEREGRLIEREALLAERQARQEAEARIAQLEAENRRLRQEG